MREPRLAALILVGAALLLVGCGRPQQVIQSGTIGANGQVGDVLLRNVYVESPPATGYPADGDAIVRLTILNQAGQPDTLTGVTSDVATHADIRADIDCDGTVETLPSLALPARADLASPPNRPGPNEAGYFLRLSDLKVGLLKGGSVPTTFAFRGAGSITLVTPVGGVTAAQRSTTSAPTPCATTPRPG